MPGTQTGLAHDHHTWRSFCLAAWIRNFSAYSGVSPLSWEKQPGSVQGPVNSLCDLLLPRPQFSLPIQGWHHHHGKPRLKKKSHNGITQPGMWCMPVTGVPSRLKQEGIYELVPGQVGSVSTEQKLQSVLKQHYWWDGSVNRHRHKAWWPGFKDGTHMMDKENQLLTPQVVSDLENKLYL